MYVYVCIYVYIYIYNHITVSMNQISENYLNPLLELGLKSSPCNKE